MAALALLVSGLLAPLTGAWADAKHARLSLLTGFTLLCCAATALLSWPGRGDIALAAVLFIAAQVGYTVAMSLYDAYVERLAPLAGGAEWLSSLGWALGFLGGLPPSCWSCRWRTKGRRRATRPVMRLPFR